MLKVGYLVKPVKLGRGSKLENQAQRFRLHPILEALRGLGAPPQRFDNAPLLTLVDPPVSLNIAGDINALVRECAERSPVATPRKAQTASPRTTLSTKQFKHQLAASP